MTVNRLSRALVPALAALLLALSSCGYALVGRASNIPADIKAVYLRPFENRTQRSQLEQFVTRAIESCNAGSRWVTIP